MKESNVVLQAIAAAIKQVDEISVHFHAGDMLLANLISKELLVDRDTLLAFQIMIDGDDENTMQIDNHQMAVHVPEKESLGQVFSSMAERGHRGEGVMRRFCTELEAILNLENKRAQMELSNVIKGKDEAMAYFSYVVAKCLASPLSKIDASRVINQFPRDALNRTLVNSELQIQNAADLFAEVSIYKTDFQLITSLLTEKTERLPIASNAISEKIKRSRMLAYYFGSYHQPWSASVVKDFAMEPKKLLACRSRMRKSEPMAKDLANKLASMNINETCQD